MPQPRASIRRLILPWSMALALVAAASGAEDLDALVRRLGDPSFEVREQATRELVDRQMKPEELRQLVERQQDPEVRIRIATVISMTCDRWIKYDANEVQKLQSSGNENGKSIYLAKATVDGTTYIGKFLTEWHGANFPIRDAEVMVDDFLIWSGTGTWKPWQPGMKRMIPMGKTKDGKVVYAARSPLNNGIHPGTLIEGETEARIPWGGGVHRVKEFEVLTSEMK